MKQYKLSKSFGIIVKTNSDKILILQRKIPYVLQDFYYYLQKRKVPYTTDSMLTKFEREWLPLLKPHDLRDYQKYLQRKPFEDMYDFPHGQLKNSHQKTFSTSDIFYHAYREFVEESGFTFSIKRYEITRFPIVCVQFIGCDSMFYEQNYFIVDNVRRLRRSESQPITSWTDDRLIYEGKLVSTDEAYQMLSRQQSIKVDMKNLLCLATETIEEMLTVDGFSLY